MPDIEQLLSAIKVGEVKRAAEILEADPGLADGRGADGGTPLLTAIYYGAKDCVRLLLEHGARPDLFEAAALGDVRRLRQALDEQPGLLQSFGHDGWSPLHLAAHFGHGAAIDWLLRRGAPLEIASGNGLANTPLHAAAAGRRRRAVELLLIAGAEPDAADSGGNTALHLAAQSGEIEIAQLLLGFSARADVRNRDGWTPLAMAAQEGHQAIVALLRHHGASD